MRNKLLFLCAAALLFCSCSMQNPQYEPVYELGSPQSKGFLTLPSEGGESSCMVYSNGEYTVSLNEEWIRFAGEEASVRRKVFSGDGGFSLSVPANPDETRYGSILMERGNRSVSIRIRQRGAHSSSAGIIASVLERTPSSLTFTWFRDPDEVTDDRADYEFNYRISLFKDAAASQLLVSYDIFVNPETGKAECWSSKQPCFAFGGLEQGRSYYFLCEELDKSEGDTYTVSLSSDLIEAMTPAFTPLTIPQAPASVGQVILSEDWSLCPWYPDLVSQSAGFLPDDRISLTSPSGVNPAGKFLYSTSSSDIFSSDYSPLLEESRLGGWSKRYDDESAGRDLVYMEAGFIRIGGGSYSGHIVTPPFRCIPQGYEATLEVKVRLARYDFPSLTDSDMAFIGTASGTEGRDGKYGPWFKPEKWDSPGAHFLIQKGWRDYTYTLDHVRSSSRLLIGPDYEKAGTGKGKIQHRTMIADLSVKLVSLTQVQEVSVSNVHYSDALVSWTALDDATVTGYELWLDGAKYGETTAASTTSMTVTGLPSGTEHSVRIKAVRATGEPSESDPVAFSTKYFRCYKTFSERVCVEWEDLVPTDKYASDTRARAYQVEVYKDEALSECYISAYSYNGSGKDEGAFPGLPSSAICGKTGNKANAYPTRATAGFLQPSTTYWFRVRSVDGIVVSNLKSGGTVTLTNVAGTSEWSMPVAVTTLPARTPSSKEVIFQGFDHFIGADWTCYAAGIGPKLATPVTYAGLDMSSYNGDWCMFSMYSYTSMKMSLWGISSPCPGEGTTYLDGPTFRYGDWSRENYVDADGWHYDGRAGSLMGQLHLCDMDTPGNGGIFFGTPPLEKNLSETPKTCVVSFGAFTTGAGYTTVTSKKLTIRVYHPDTGVIDDGVELALPVRYIPATGAKSSDYMFDTSFYPLQGEVALKKGDVVIIGNEMTANRIIIDDFLIEVK